jgi:hypothetical protein
MYKINRIVAIVVFAFIILPISFLVKIPIWELNVRFIFVIVTIAQKFSKRLDWTKPKTATNT